MIIQNGTIEFMTNRNSGGLDENGYPVPVTVEYSNPIPCQYAANTFSNLGKNEGERFIRATYSILVEYLVPCVMTERLRLKDKYGRVVKEFSVLEFEPLDAVSQFRILV